jgi:hypothetical protein
MNKILQAWNVSETAPFAYSRGENLKRAVAFLEQACVDTWGVNSGRHTSLTLTRLLQYGTIGGRCIKVLFDRNGNLLLFSDTDETRLSKAESAALEDFSYEALPSVNNRLFKIPILRNYHIGVRVLNRSSLTAVGKAAGGSGGGIKSGTENSGNGSGRRFTTTPFPSSYSVAPALTPSLVSHTRSPTAPAISERSGRPGIVRRHSLSSFVSTASPPSPAVQPISKEPRSGGGGRRGRGRDGTQVRNSRAPKIQSPHTLSGDSTIHPVTTPSLRSPPHFDQAADKSHTARSASRPQTHVTSQAPASSEGLRAPPHPTLDVAPKVTPKVAPNVVGVVPTPNVVGVAPKEERKKKSGTKVYAVFDRRGVDYHEYFRAKSRRSVKNHVLTKYAGDIRGHVERMSLSDFTGAKLDRFIAYGKRTTLPFTSDWISKLDSVRLNAVWKMAFGANGWSNDDMHIERLRPSTFRILP